MGVIQFILLYNSSTQEDATLKTERRLVEAHPVISLLCYKATIVPNTREIQSKPSGHHHSSDIKTPDHINRFRIQVNALILERLESEQ